MCRSCENVIGHVETDDSKGLYIRLYNFRLVEFKPIRNTENMATHLVARTEEVPNHLKRKADCFENEPIAKTFQPNTNDPVCSMRVSVPQVNPLPIVLPEFDLNLFNVDYDGVRGESLLSLPEMDHLDFPDIIIDEDYDTEFAEFLNLPILEHFFEPQTPPGNLLVRELMYLNLSDFIYIFRFSTRKCQRK